MSINGSTILQAPSAATYSGGTSAVATDLGKTNGVGRYFVDDGNSSPLNERIVLEFSTVEPRASASAPNGYTQARTNVAIKMPLALDNGKVTMNTLTIKLGTDVETTEAERGELLLYAAQILNNADFRPVFDDLSLA